MCPMVSNRPERAAPITSSKYGATISGSGRPATNPATLDALYGDTALMCTDPMT